MISTVSGRVSVHTVMTDPKPTLTVVPGDKVDDLEALLGLFRTLTGREPTPEEIEEAKAELEADDD